MSTLDFVDRDTFDTFAAAVRRNIVSALLVDLASVGSVEIYEGPQHCFDVEGWVLLFEWAGYTHDGEPADRPTQAVELFRGSHRDGRFGMSWTIDLDGVSVRRRRLEKLQGRPCLRGRCATGAFARLHWRIHPGRIRIRCRRRWPVRRQRSPVGKLSEMKVVAYLRCSTARQQETFGPRCSVGPYADGSTPAGTAWCHGRPTISGTSEPASRAGWLAAEQLVTSGKAGGIVVARLDRLIRDVLVQELLLRNTQQVGGVVMSARDSENELLAAESKDPSSKLIRTILGAISEYDREMIADRLEAARKAKAAAGGYGHGALPYGWRSVAGEQVPYDIEQFALARMKSLAEQGASTREIATTLTAEGHPTKRGGKCSSPTVARILKRDYEIVAFEGG